MASQIGAALKTVHRQEPSYPPAPRVRCDGEHPENRLARRGSLRPARGRPPREQRRRTHEVTGRTMSCDEEKSPLGTRSRVAQLVHVRTAREPVGHVRIGRQLTHPVELLSAREPEYNGVIASEIHHVPTLERATSRSRRRPRTARISKCTIAHGERPARRRRRPLSPAHQSSVPRDDAVHRRGHPINRPRCESPPDDAPSPTHSDEGVRHGPRPFDPTIVLNPPRRPRNLVATHHTRPLRRREPLRSVDHVNVIREATPYQPGRRRHAQRTLAVVDQGSPRAHLARLISRHPKHSPAGRP